MKALQDQIDELKKEINALRNMKKKRNNHNKEQTNLCSFIMGCTHRRFQRVVHQNTNIAYLEEWM